MIDVESLQAAIDDASEDHLYVSPDRVVEMPHGLGFEWATHGDNDVRREEALCFGLKQAARLWRANGGVGRVVVAIQSTERGLEGRLTVWTSAMDALEGAMK